MPYSIAFAKEDGSWDIVESGIERNTDAEAEAYAEENYPAQEWYVLDTNGQNINS